MLRCKRSVLIELYLLQNRHVYSNRILPKLKYMVHEILYSCPIHADC